MLVSSNRVGMNEVGKWYSQPHLGGGLRAVSKSFPYLERRRLTFGASLKKLLFSLLLSFLLPSPVH